MSGNKLSKGELRVMLWDHEIGRLAWNAQAGRTHFFFSPQYFDMGVDIAPLIAPKGSNESHFAIYGDTSNKIYQKLPVFLADALPDDWGNTLFDQWFKSQGLHEKEKTPIAKLSFIGKRAMGAFEFLPCEEVDCDPNNLLSIQSLYELATKIENERDNVVITPEETLTQKALLAVGTSAGGRFKKAIIAIAPDGSIHSGQTSTNSNWRYCILKFNYPEMCISEIEYTYYQLALEAGINIEHSELISVDGVRHFLTERFDRKNGKKILTMSLAAINPDAQSYEDLFATCRKLNISEKEKSQVFRRMVFNILASNTDDHAKNISFMMDESCCWHISPAFDLNFIFRSRNTAETDHCLTLCGKRSCFTKRDLLDFAKEFNIKSANTIIEDVRNALCKVEEVAAVNGVRGDVSEIISGRLQQIGAEFDGKSLEDIIWPSYRINGHQIDSFHFAKDEKGSIRIVAIVDGKPKRKIISFKNPDYLLIANQFNGSSDAIKKKYAKQYLLGE